MDTAARAANARDMGTPGTMVDRGLEGIVVGATALSGVDGATGRLSYRGYDIDDLAVHASFEEVGHLLLFGELPNVHQLADFNVRMAASRPLPPMVLEWLSGMPADAWPMDVLRTAVSALALFTPHRDDAAHPVSPRSAIGLIAKTPTIVAAWDRLRRGLRPIDPLPNLSTAANFLYMRSGKMPIPEATNALDTYLVLLADHSFNASTFAARVTASTHADLFAAATTGLATLSGDSHGDAPSEVMASLLAIDTPANAANWVRDTLARGERITGMGHREYRERDPRAAHLERVARELAETSNVRSYAVARALEDAASAALPEAEPGKPVRANVDFYTAPTLFGLGIPADEFACVFACARMAGWMAHALEQLAAGRLIRPQAEFLGKARAFVPLERRGATPETTV